MSSVRGHTIFSWLFADPMSYQIGLSPGRPLELLNVNGRYISSFPKEIVLWWKSCDHSRIQAGERKDPEIQHIVFMWGEFLTGKVKTHFLNQTCCSVCAELHLASLPHYASLSLQQFFFNSVWKVTFGTRQILSCSQGDYDMALILVREKDHNVHIGK